MSFEQKLGKIIENLSKEADKPNEHLVTRPIEGKYLKHAFQHPYTKRSDISHRLMDMPTCGRCERLAFRDRRPYDPLDKLYVTCPVCGYHGPPGPIVRMHVKEV